MVESVLQGLSLGTTDYMFKAMDVVVMGFVPRATGATHLQDKITDIPRELEVKRLRLFKIRTLMPVGTTTPISTEVRIICATKRRLFFFSSRRRHTRFDCDWSSDVCSSD